MKVIGLAGHAGSGKSVIAQKLSKREGIVAVDLDKVAWETYRPHTPTYWRLVARFGKGILNAEGMIDRSQLGALVFSDARALADLNAIVHPAVIDRLQTIIQQEKARGTRILLVEGALLASSLYVDRSLFEVILWLEASSKTRRRRLQAAGRSIHIERTLPEPDGQNAITVDAEGPIAEVASRITDVIESL